MKEKIMFFSDVLLLWNVFAVLKLKKKVMLKDQTVRWLIEKNNPLRGKESLLIIKGL